MTPLLSDVGMPTSIGSSLLSASAAQASLASVKHGLETTRRPLFSRTWVAAVVAGVVVLTLTVAGSVLLAVRTGNAIALTGQTRLVQSAVSRLLEAVQDAESGQRGFLLTGKPEYLVPYEAAVSKLPGMFGRLAEAVRNNPASAAEIAPVRASADRKLAELDRTVTLFRSGDRDGAMALVQTDSGNREMEALRELTGRVLASHSALVERETDRITRDREILIIFDLLGLWVIVLLIGSAIVGVRRALSALQTSGAALALANAELERSNETLEESVDKRTSDLRAANEEIQRFAYIVSHDLRAPLVNIMGFTSELETVARSMRRFVETAGPAAPGPALADVQLAVEEDLPEAIRFIKTSAAKMDRLIGAILQLSREGRRVLKPERVALRALLTGIVESMAIQLAERGAAVEVGDAPDLVSDRLALEQVFSNLLENAIKYAKPGRPPRIAVRAGIVDGFLEIDVEDNGRGIAARDHERIFELFRRAGDQTVPGEGIGLAHVRALVRRLGGRIDCLSTLDVGTTFRVQLPLVLVQGGANG